MKTTTDEFFPIIDKKTYKVASHLGLSLKVVYRFWVSDFKKVRMGIIITTMKNVAKIKVGPIDKMDFFIQNDDVILLPNEIDKILNTQKHCVDDFKKDHPEFRKFIII